MIYAGNPNMRALPIPTKPRDSGTTQPILRKPVKHGTVEGYRRHLQIGIGMCVKCAQAGMAPDPDGTTPRRWTSGGIEHGTPKGYQAHFRRGVPMCDECRAANTTYRAQVRAKRKANR